MLQKLLPLLANRHVATSAGLIALSLIIWFTGPLLGIGESRPLESALARALVIVVLVLLALIVEFVRVVRARQAASKLGQGIVQADGAGEDRSAEEVATLKKRFEEAVAVLRKSGTGRKSTGLYDLPWYIIIGPPGSGKTTALANSGLRFPLAERFGNKALRGVGGTRNCDWWFTDEAILLDTAGRYTTQDSDARSDRAAWQGFLDLLKRYRRRRPINGVMVAISLSDLMLLSEPERQAHARAIRQRIQELDAHFRMRFPVYLLLTKADLIAGFTEFFEDLASEERAQVWGFTRELGDRDEAVDGELVIREFEQLVKRLESRLLARLQDERDPGRRRLIFGFPQQIAGLKKPLADFVQEVFSGNRFEDAPLLRGVYFTSGTQEGTPIDRLMGSLARTFGLGQAALPSFAGKGRSYFITRLLRDVLFQESEMAGTNRGLERQRAWLQWGTYVALAAVVLLGVAGWAVSFRGNLSLIDTVASQVGEAGDLLGAAAPGTDPGDLEPVLGMLRNLPGGYGEEESGHPFRLGLGLYQGDELGPQAREAYRRVLLNNLLPRMMARLEGQIGQPDAPLAQTYEALKVYLMLGSDEHYQRDAVRAWFVVDWERNHFPAWGQERFDRMLGHLDALLDPRPMPLPIPLDASLVRQARDRVALIPLEERIYSRLKDYDLDKGIVGFSVQTAGGPEAGAVFVRSSGQPLTAALPGFFTKAAHDRLFLKPDSLEIIDGLLRERWVLRDDAPDLSQDELRALLARVKDLYLLEYASAYDALMRDLKLRSFDNPADGSRILGILARPGVSPLQKLLEGLKTETSFCAPVAPAPGTTPGPEDANAPPSADPYEKLRKLLGSAGAAPAEGPGVVECTNPVEQRFGALNATPVEGTLAILGQLAQAMTTVKLAGDKPTDAGTAAQLAATVDQAQLEAARQPEPLLTDVLATAAGGAARIGGGGVAKGINEQWALPLKFCEDAISGRYPLVRDSQKEVSLADFARFFGAGGELDRFFQGPVRDMVDMSRRPWRSRDAGGVNVRLTNAAVAMFERGASIREMYFQGGAQPSVPFQLVPVGMDASINEFKLTLDGQTTSYFNGPLVPRLMQWPGPGSAGEVRLEMSPPVGVSSRWQPGPWAWFRILDEAGVQPAGTPGRFGVTFTVGGRGARYEIIPGSAYHPYGSRVIQQFRCERRLTG